jgi:hypothetical protein
MSEYKILDWIVKTIINELGPIGLLIVGLYWILGKHLKKISKSIEKINHNTTKMIEVIERNADRICEKINGKN